METNNSLLIIDDDEAIRESFHYFFEDLGFQVTSVDSAEKALNNFKKKIFDIALIDVKLPGISGFDLLRKMSKLEIKTVAAVVTGSISFNNIPNDLGSYDNLIKKIYNKPLLKKDMILLAELLKNKSENLRCYG